MTTIRCLPIHYSTIAMPVTPLLDTRTLDRDGFAIVTDAIPSALIERARATLDVIDTSQPAVRVRRGSAFAIRNVLDLAPQLREISECRELISLVSAAMGNGAFITRAILFDKTEQANWAVPWHQDTTIAVRHRTETNGFGPWSMKSGVLHVQPPASILEGVLTARIHLDDCPAENGALRVIPGSHRGGILSTEAISGFKSHGAVTCPAKAGDTLLMRPLLLHASSAATVATRRRIMHLEFAVTELPHGLEWHRQ